MKSIFAVTVSMCLLFLAPKFATAHEAPPRAYFNVYNSFFDVSSYVVVDGKEYPSSFFNIEELREKMASHELASRHLEDYQSHGIMGFTFSLIGIATAITGFALIAANGSGTEGAAIGLGVVFGSLGFTFASVSMRNNSIVSLNKAVNAFNGVYDKRAPEEKTSAREVTPRLAWSWSF